MRRMPLGVLLLSLCSFACSGQNTVKDRYQTVEVNQFEVHSGVEFPAKYLPKLQDDVLRGLKRSKLFRNVVRPGETPVAPEGNTIRLTGTIMRFAPGSSVARFFTSGVLPIGPALGGHTLLFVHLVYLDQLSGKPIIVDDANATIVDSFSPQDVFQQLALQVVTGAKLNVGKRLPEVASVPALSVASTSASVPPAALTETTPSSTLAPSTPAQLESSTLVATDATSSTHAVQPSDAPPATLSSASVAAAAVPTPDHHTVNFSRRDFPSFQLRLNKEAADGYRFADFALTGNDSAEVVLEKLSTPEKYDYLVLRPGGPRVIDAERELNKAAAEGYRLCKQSVSFMVFDHWHAGLTLIFEKSPNAAATRYTYRVHQVVQVSSLQSDTAKDQSDGYLLVASTSWAGVHFGVLEKEVNPDAAKSTQE